MHDPKSLHDDRTHAPVEAGDLRPCFYDHSVLPYKLDGRELGFQHRVNTRAALELFLRSSAKVAEGDVLLGTLSTGSGLQAVMAHPPDRHSDLSFDDWLKAMAANGRCIKVDFKDPAVVTPVLEYLHRESFPAHRLMLNADILRGPGGGPSQFSVDDLRLCREAYPGAVISIGCTTGPNAGPYSDTQIGNLLQAGEFLGRPYTFALRAELLLADLSVLQVLSDHDAHVTIWNATNHPNEEGWCSLLQESLPLAFFDLLDP